MEEAYVISFPSGLTRTREILELNERIRGYGKNVQLQAYDTVQGLHWNGGRVIASTEMEGHPASKRMNLYDVTVNTLEEAVSRVRLLNDNGISFNLTINNVMESVDVDDEDGNYFLRRIQNDMNWVTVATKSLARHIRSEFPKFKPVASICFAYSRLEDYVRACEQFDLVVMMPYFAYLPEALDALPVEKICFIANDHCALFCRRKEHYEIISRASMAGNVTRIEQELNLPKTNCLFDTLPGYKERAPDGGVPEFFKRVEAMACVQCESNLDKSLLPGGEEFAITSATRKELIRRGVTHFKLEGRELSTPVFEKQVVQFLDAFVRDEL